MQKPITMIREETKIALANIINNSGLPPFIIEPILAEFLTETRIAAQQQYENEKAEYEEQMKQEGQND